jgi:hypothetical protein
MLSVYERSKSQKVRENESTAALLATPRGTPRPSSRRKVPQKTPSRRLDTQGPGQTLPARSRAQGTLPTPEDGTQTIQMIRDSVPPPAPVPFSNINFPLPEPPTSDIKMEDT